MKRHIHSNFLEFCIWLLLSCTGANAEISSIPQTAEVKYHHFYYPDSYEMYNPFLPSLASKELRYHTRMIADANIDDTPEKETIVLIVVDTKYPTPFGEWIQAFLLITDTGAAVPKKKALFTIFDSGTLDLEVPAKAIELHSPPFVFKERLNDAPWKPRGVSFRLIDLTGDGILDIWVEAAYGVALISFQNSEFKEVFSNYTVTRQKLAETLEVEYHYYDSPIEPQGRLYHRFLSAPAPEERYYDTRMTATANIDDTPEKETVVLMTLETGTDGPRGEWSRAYLLIAETEADVLKKKALFKFFGAGLEVPAKTIEGRYPPLIFRKSSGGPWQWGRLVSLKLVDLTGDGTLDIWVNCVYGVVVISFQNGEFKEICSGYTSIRSEPPAGYVDIDNDGIYEIKIPNRIFTGRSTAEDLDWMSLYAWNGTTYVLDNPKYYSQNDDILIQLLSKYNTWLVYEAASLVDLRQPGQRRRFSRYSESCEFYIGMALYYRGDLPRAGAYLQRVVTEGENEDYIKAAESVLKKLSRQKTNSK